MIISKRKVGKVAVKVEDYITIDIYKVISLALLSIYESLNLISLIKVIRLSIFDGLLVLWPRESSLYLGLCVFIGILESQEVYIMLILVFDIYLQGST